MPWSNDASTVKMGDQSGRVLDNKMIGMILKKYGMSKASDERKVGAW
jgi:hypothetical protein